VSAANGATSGPAEPGTGVADLAGEITAAAAALRASADFPGTEVAGIERALARRGSAPAKGDQLRRAIGQIEVHVGIDLDVPTASQVPGLGRVKALIKKAIGWYLRFIGYQLTGLGHALVGFGNATADRVDEVEEDIDGLERRVEALEQHLGIGR
jgi:hypothetical protein